MNTETTERNNKGTKGEVFYDANCSLCMRGVRHFSGLFRRDFDWVPMQTAGTAERLHVTTEDLYREMILRKADGQLVRGIDTWIVLMRTVWWLYPVALLFSVPGVHFLAQLVYRFIARNRYCFGGSCALPGQKIKGPGLIEMVASAVWPAIVGLLTWRLPGWIFMWSLAVAFGFAGKWIALRDAMAAGARLTLKRLVIWFFAWPGMDGRRFFDCDATVVRPKSDEWFLAGFRLLLGLSLFAVIAPHLLLSNRMFAGWAAMVGLVLILHFGLFHLLSLLWRAVGIDAQPIMNAPLRSTSLGEFWGLRWNTAFSIPARRLVLRPLARRLNVAAASLLIFVLSGILHELVITLPAKGGYGLPTAYFIFQGIGVALQDSRFGKALRGGWRGWLFTMIVAAGPVYWLFPPVFVCNVVLPMIRIFFN